MNTHATNPRVTTLLLSVTAIEVLVLLGSGGGLLFLPATLPEIWPWSLTPFNTAFLGAVYLAAMVTAMLLVLIGRWSPARVVVPMILIFTVIILVISLVYLDRFALKSPSTWLWFVLYIGIPLNAAYHVWRYRLLPPASSLRLSAGWRVYLLAQAGVLGLYGLGLLVAPDRFSAFWPWPVDAFHARLYSAAFITPALGSLLLVRAAAREEVLTMGLTLMALGFLPVLGIVMVDVATRRVNWMSGGTWVWIGGFALLVAAGIGLMWTSRRLPRLTTRINEAGFVISSRAVALVIGVAFTAAGLAGFLPMFTHQPPADAPHLILHQNYGYLLQLFPVNIIHSLFHLITGILGLLSYRRAATARTFVRGFAVALAVLTVMGALPGLNTTFGLAPLFGHDVWLHGVEAAAAAYVGFVMPSGDEVIR